MKISSVSVQSFWPTLSPYFLSFAELERDPYFDQIPKDQIPHYVTKAMQIGEMAAQSHLLSSDWVEQLNHMLKQGIQIRFQPRHPESSSIRANYNKKRKTIEIYRSSIEQLQRFFRRFALPIEYKDLIRLHLYHEWFHHLEETRWGRTDQKLPKLHIQQWGPIVKKGTVQQTREIAAHHFTQKALGLTWSPLLLDQLLLLDLQGLPLSRIREHFENIKIRHDRLVGKETDTQS